MATGTLPFPRGSVAKLWREYRIWPLRVPCMRRSWGYSGLPHAAHRAEFLSCSARAWGVTVSAQVDVETAIRGIFAGKIKQGWVLNGLWCYTDELGVPLYYRTRFDPPTDSIERKLIRPLHLNGIGWKAGEPKFPTGKKPLYRLHELSHRRGQILWIVEGEKKVDALVKLGFLATTSGGATSAKACDWTPAADQHCVLWRDFDAPGLRYAEEVSAILRARGCTVEWVDVEALCMSEGDDVCNWLDAHPGAVLADVEALPRRPCAPAATRAEGVELVEAASLKPEPIHWLWPGWLARGKLHVLAGAPGTGKTTLAMDVAACVSAGRALPSGWRPQRGSVLIWSGEDDPADTLVPRLIAAGADLSCIQFVGNVRECGESYPFDPAHDVDKLAAAALGDVALLIIDPLVSAVSGDSHRNAEVRRGLAPLVELAQRQDVAVLGITHYSKGTQGREPLERVSGSLAFGALARIVLGTVRQHSNGENTPRRFTLARCKSNIGADGGGFAYELEQAEATTGVTTCRVAWGAEMEGTARELLADPDQIQDDRSDSGGCARWLREELKHGERDAKAVEGKGNSLGYSSKVIRRAREKLGVKPRKGSFETGWVWSLPFPEDAHRDAEDAQQNKVVIFPENGRLRAPSSDEMIEGEV